MTAPPENAKAGQLVWLSGLNGSEAQIWHGDFNGNEFSKGRVLKAHPLTAGEVSLPLNTLIAKYPAPPIPADEEDAHV